MNQPTTKYHQPNNRPNGQGGRAMRSFARNRAAKLLLLILALALFATACGDTSVATDEMVIVYGEGGKDGEDIKSIHGPGSDPFDKGDSGRPVVRIPLSKRFYNIVRDALTRDPGAPRFIPFSDRDAEAVTGEFTIEFIFNQAPAVIWYDENGLRNTKEPGTYCSEDGTTCIELPAYDMGFNQRGILTPWLQYLAETFAKELDRVLNNVVGPRYDWAELYFNYPMAADEFGVLPSAACVARNDLAMVEYETALASAESEQDSAEEGVTVEVPVEPTLEECPDPAEEDLRRTIVVFEGELGLEFTQAINEKLGQSEVGTIFSGGSAEDISGEFSFFCGPTHNQIEPESCPPMLVRVVGKITPVDESLIEVRREENRGIEALESSRKAAELAAQQAIVDEQLRQIDEQEQIDIARSQARIDQAQAEANEQEGGLELERQEILLDGERVIAPCTALRITDGFECAALLGKLPERFGSNIDPSTLGTMLEDAAEDALSG